MMDTSQIEGFVNFTDEELALVLKGVGGCAGPKITVYDWYCKLDRYATLRKKIKQKGVFIITDCGQEHYIEPDQSVKEIYVDGKLVHSSTGSANNG